ncbi:cell wall hydrolase [Sphingomonas sp. IC-11]|uniref:cell wall hydrolase n=1 Tax=Sphingomonas sp. IC-11 TaxID=2898528 RepID=UPI001E3C6015|nr:cell wall hydrolase [Sphingomonas sp. IC-11]
MPTFRPLHLILAAIALAAIALPLIVTHLVPHVAVEIGEPIILSQRAVVPQAAPPPVEPVEYAEIAPEDARAINAAVPFVKGPVPPARPFRFVGGTEEFARATDCLAAAAYYEAGDDAVGERAVVQVVLNRLRHPAFPKTVCGVVFQGAERITGCQFTFTCDGALRRTPSPAAWTRARDIAAKALRGSVYKPVGWATHYHTDWVVPYWSSSLDKIAEVNTHLFFRWTGWWGTGPAFNRGQQPGEATIPQLAAISEYHRGGAPLADDVQLAEAVPFFGRTPAPLAGDRDTFLTMLNPSQADTFQGMALASCGERPRCKFMGWTEPDAMAFTLPLTPEQMNAMSFSYIRDRGSNFERALWNCEEFKKRAPCMKRMTLRAAPAPQENVRGPAELEGVRRKADAIEPPPGNAAGVE